MNSTLFCANSKLTPRRMTFRGPLLACCAVLLPLMAMPASAMIIRVPYRDWSDWVIRINVDNPYEALTLVDDTFYMKDSIWFGLTPPSDGGDGGFLGGGYAFVVTGPDGGLEPGTLMVTTVYGIAQDPNDPEMRLTGFNAANPEITPLSEENIYSQFGTHYTSFSQETVLLSEIGGVLPDHDLSVFAGGDPNSILYVFRTLAPENEFMPPECCPADANCDGVVDFFDLDPFLNILLNGEAGCSSCNGDVNRDGNIDFFDLDASVNAILNGACQ